MQVTSSHQLLQDFVLAISYGKFENIKVDSADGQAQALDHLMQLLHYCEQYGTNIPEGLHIFSEFFAIPYVEKFFSDLLVNLHESLILKAESVFLRGLAFTVEYIGPPKSRETVYLLIEKIQKRFPVLKEMYDKAIANFIDEFFRPTIGDFIKQHKNAVDHLEVTYPLLYSLFVAPVKAQQFADRRLYNFYCNPWIYQSIVRYLAYHNRLSSPEINRKLLESPIEWLEERLQIIHSQTTDESWQELTNKARGALNHSEKLEPFAIEIAGLLGEIKTSAQFIKSSCDPEDILTFLPQLKDEPGCDLIVKRLKANSYDLIECKAKTPRHGLDEKIAGEVQIWDDFFTNFNHAICSYLNYLQETIQPPLGLIKCFPLFIGFEGSNYGSALPLIENIPTATNAIPLKKWTSEQKLSHLLRALFLRPLILKPCCVQLPSDEARLTQRQQVTKEALQKEWVNTLLEKATEQLEKTYQRQKTEGRQISKMYVALDLDLSYRLRHDPLSYHDGNIGEIAAQTLHGAFQPFKKAFAAKGLDLDLLIVQP
ncbi:hypothetical protein [Candidatus Protochlamydia phocaeensis]|uniref:hypothetical protein n=1 Tax=Candidatus Protochlamydia phocaeensis TaxID=1414722 RepID=UPI0008386C73|nr:hypothetical protein [Candidatus Protochlamydia phocaeensis]